MGDENFKAISHFPFSHVFQKLIMGNLNDFYISHILIMGNAVRDGKWEAYYFLLFMYR